MSDELGIAAHPLMVIQRSGTANDVAEIAGLVSEHGVGTIVVGLPLELSGKAGLRAKRVRTFIEAVQAGIESSVEIVEWDERFSTVAVERVLLDADLSRRRRKQVVDKQAAAYILQGWLDAQERAQ
jgi:putative Holliday junction resolvase